jgi:hypothetical protein
MENPFSFDQRRSRSWSSGGSRTGSMATAGPEASTEATCAAVAGSEINIISGGSGAAPDLGCGNDTDAARPKVVAGGGSAERISAART